MKQAYTPHRVRHIENLREMLATSAQLYGENVAFSQNEGGVWRSYTFAQYLRDVRSLCLALDDELQKTCGKPLYGQEPSFGVLTVRDGQVLFSHGTLQ